jgi:hypothetical protein
MSSDETRTVRLELDVQDCGRAHLMDRELGADAATPAQSTEIIEVEHGCANLRITHQWGPARFTVTVADRDPGADLTGFEDIVEIGYVSTTGHLEMTGFTFDEPDMRPLPPLPAGPGAYRIRYHVKGMDLEGTDDAVDDHYLQIWPAPFDGPVVVKATSGVFQP